MDHYWSYLHEQWTDEMNTRLPLAVLLLAVATLGFGQAQPSNKPTSHLEVRIERFEVTDAILRDAVSRLSLEKLSGLHLGFEEIIRNRIQDDPRSVSPHFSLHLQKKSVQEILDALCQADERYTWSEDGSSVNIFPRATEDDPSYLLNLKIDRLDVTAIPDPDQALTPLSKLFPQQQVGYFGPGLGDNTYAEPWTMVFNI